MMGIWRALDTGILADLRREYGEFWPADRLRSRVNFYLTDHQGLRLLCIGAQCNLFTVRSIQPMENAMTNETLIVRVAQVLLAVTATAASVLVVQFAMLVG
jgi:hypothetical protein